MVVSYKAMLNISKWTVALISTALFIIELNYYFHPSADFNLVKIILTGAVSLISFTSIWLETRVDKLAAQESEKIRKQNLEKHRFLVNALATESERIRSFHAILNIHFKGSWDLSELPFWKLEPFPPDQNYFAEIWFSGHGAPVKFYSYKPFSFITTGLDSAAFLVDMRVRSDDAVFRKNISDIRHIELVIGNLFLNAPAKFKNKIAEVKKFSMSLSINEFTAELHSDVHLPFDVTSEPNRFFSFPAFRNESLSWQQN